MLDRRGLTLVAPVISSIVMASARATEPVLAKADQGCTPALQIRSTAPADVLFCEQHDAFPKDPYERDASWRAIHFSDIIRRLSTFHYENCEHYRNILAALGVDLGSPTELGELPFLPVGLFKRFDMLSVPASDVTRVLTSSGTSRSSRSRIFIDRETSILQMRALSSIVTSVLGAEQLPLLIVDAPAAPEGHPDYAARTVAIRGFSLFGKGEPRFALTRDLRPDLRQIEDFLAKVSGQRFLLFGFTYVILRYFFQCLEESGTRLDFSNGILLHGGGWKRLAQNHVTSAAFRDSAQTLTGLTRCHDYYGMVEQAGSIYLQCERGFMHCSNFSDILIRRSPDLSVAQRDEPGIIQTLSLLPRSYPGHNLLTEDLGVLRGEDDCACGRKGKYFDILGRLPTAVPKGCGDTYFAAG